MGDVISKATEVLIHQKATTRKIPMAVFSSLSNHLADGVEIKERQREQLIFLVDLVPLLLHAADELSAHVEWDLPDQLVVVHVDGLHTTSQARCHMSTLQTPHARQDQVQTGLSVVWMRVGESKGYEERTEPDIAVMSLKALLVVIGRDPSRPEAAVAPRLRTGTGAGSGVGSGFGIDSRSFTTVASFCMRARPTRDAQYFSPNECSFSRGPLQHAKQAREELRQCYAARFLPTLHKSLLVPCGFWPCNRASKSSLRAASSCFSRSVGCLFCILVDRIPEGDRTPSSLSSPPFGNVIDIESRAGSERAFAVREPQTDSAACT